MSAEREPHPGGEKACGEPKPVLYPGTSLEDRQAVLHLYELWQAAARPNEADPIGARRQRFLGRPLSITPDEEAILARIGGDMSGRLFRDHLVRLMLWAEELGVSPYMEDWVQRTEALFMMRGVRGGVDWFEPRKKPGKAPRWPAEVLQEAAALLEGLSPGRRGRRGAVQEALHPLLVRLKVPSQAMPEVARELSEAVRRRRARLTKG
jgi:hypothetical protein